MDVSTIVTEIDALTGATGPIAVVGLAMLGIGVAFLVYKTVRRMLGR